MIVKATKRGFYGGRLREAHDGPFELSSPKHFSEKWMEKVETRGRGKKVEVEPEPEEVKAYNIPTESMTIAGAAGDVVE